jgi:prolyl-tRNA synthetase
LTVSAGSPAMNRAEEIYRELSQRGIDVILDDRDDRPGVKFKDADLVGFPLRIAIGEKSLSRNEVELKPRGGLMISVPADQATAKVLELLAAGILDL